MVGTFQSLFLHRLKPRLFLTEPEMWLFMIHKANKLHVGYLGVACV